MKHARLVALAAALVILTTVGTIGCASADHSWRGEFDARLEGASAAIGEAAPKFGPAATETGISRAGIRLGRELAFKNGLIAKLGPPSGCVAVDEEGQRKVGEFGSLVFELYKNLTPSLRERLPREFKEEVAELARIEGEAEACA